MKNSFLLGWVGNTFIASEKLIKVYIYRGLSGIVREYIREISVAMSKKAVESR